MADNDNSPVNERFTNRIDKDIPDDTEELLKAIQAVGLAEKTMWASISAMKKDGDLQRFREAIRAAGDETDARIRAENAYYNRVNELASEKAKRAMEYDRQVYARMSLQERAKLQQSLKDEEALKKAQLERARAVGSAEQIAEAERELTGVQRQQEAVRGATGDSLKSAIADGFKSGFKSEEFKSVLTSVGNTISSAFDAIERLVDPTVKFYSELMPKIDTRLLGVSDGVSTTSQFLKSINKELATSPWIRQRDVATNFQKYVELGIAYNLEERSYIATVSDKIATTFNAFDSNLLRLIRLQEADTTIARLGIEASLNEFFNKRYKDTSYLNSLRQTVQSAIIDANSQLTKDTSVQFEYTLQKWLGSMYSLGLSESAVSSIATGINYLGSGNVSALTSNTQLQTLLALATTRAGLSYGNIMTQGLSAENTNKILRSMVEYLKSIYSSSNQAVKSAYGDIFGLSVADLRAITNLTEQDLDDIFGTSITYNQSIEKVDAVMSSVHKRMTLATKFENVVDNLKFTLGSNIAESRTMLDAYLISGLIRKTAGSLADIGVPLMKAVAIGAGIVEGGTVVIGGVKTFIDAISSLSNSWKLRSDYFGYEPYLRGTISQRADLLSESGLSSLGGKRTSISGSALYSRGTTTLSTFGYTEPTLTQIRNEQAIAEATGNTEDTVANIDKKLDEITTDETMKVQVTNTITSNANVESMNSSVINAIAKAVELAVTEKIIAEIRRMFSGNDDVDTDQPTLQQLINTVVNESVKVRVDSPYFDTAMDKIQRSSKL